MILEVQNGCFGYPKQPVILESINLSLEEGHILAILGPNGIGKTTLLKCMIGLLPWHSGKTLLYGKDIHTLKPKDVWSTMHPSAVPQLQPPQYFLRGFQPFHRGSQQRFQHQQYQNRYRIAGCAHHPCGFTSRCAK